MPHRDASNEYPTACFNVEIRKIIIKIKLFSGAMITLGSYKL